jgi:hypothetical protein
MKSENKNTNCRKVKKKKRLRVITPELTEDINKKVWHPNNIKITVSR